MRVCPACGGKFRFKDVLFAVNPIRIPCSSCKAPIRPSWLPVSILLVLLLAACISVALMSGGALRSHQVWVFGGLLGLGVVFELIFYVGLVSGFFASNLKLVDSNLDNGPTSM